MTMMQKSPQYGYYPNPADQSVIEYGPYDTAIQYSPYADKPRTGSAKPASGTAGEPDQPGQEIEPGKDYGRAPDLSFGGIAGPAPSDPSKDAADLQQKKRRRASVLNQELTGPRFAPGTSLLSR